MLRGLQGEAAVPPGRRTLPSDKGLHGNPTFASNAETFAQLGLLATHGADGFLPSLGGSESGTMLVTVWGAVPYAGVREVRAGTELSAICGGTGSPVLVGGYHGTWVPDVSQLRLDRATLRAAGVHLGAGVFARLPSDTCALGEVTRVAHWLSAERSGRCGPCHFGLPAVAADLEALLSGRIGSEGLQRLRRRIGLLPGRGACAHPDGAAQFVRTALTSFDDEVAQHLAHGTCGRGCRGVLPLEPVGMAR
jgi:NADH:ubiquinone oxidoreductase subunit F (NADH-binding)